MTTTKTPGFNCRLDIFFTTDRRGRKIAYYYSWAAQRAIRMPLADAEIFVATDAADLLPGHPFKVA
jgi:hypothetical protein